MVATAAATLPLELEHNRPFVLLELLRPDGMTRQPVRFAVDTGGGSLIVAEPVARALHLPFGRVFRGEGERWAETRIPSLWAGALELDLEGVQALILLDRPSVMPGQAAQGLLPGRVLARHRVCFDYPERRLTLSRPGAGRARGEPVPSPVHPETGFPRLEVEIDGEAHGLLLDTGAACTMLSAALVERLAAAHPEWPTARGAFGAANMVGGPFDAGCRMTRLPALTVGPFALEGVAAVSRPTGVFEEQMSRLTTEPIVGALAGNVLRHFRVEIDYAAGVTYLELHGAPDPSGEEMVGLVLQPHPSGVFTVSATTPDLTEQVQPGDRLLQVDGMAITGLSLPRAVEALRGRAGQRKSLLLEKGGVRRIVQAEVRRIL